MVNDNPENALLREVDQIRQSQKEMKKTLEMVTMTKILYDKREIFLFQNLIHRLNKDCTNSRVPLNTVESPVPGECTYELLGNIEGV